MRVLKFGGTSVGSVDSLNKVKQITEKIDGGAIIVVSALGGVTDKLIEAAHKAENGEDSWRKDLDDIRERHLAIIEKMVPENLKKKVLSKIEPLFKELGRNYEGVVVLGELLQKTLDVIVSYGERMSSIIIAAIIENGKRYYSPDFIKTENWYGKNVANFKYTDQLIKEAFKDMSPKEKAIVPGFISSDIATGEITNLGRGGSDFTGALLAASMNADVLEIWTDVDGFMTADPRIVNDAKIIEHLTFTEAMELCNFGAKVVYPPTIYPVFHKNIPIKILNTFIPSASGTVITDQSLASDLEIKGVSALKNISYISFKINQEDKDNSLTKEFLNILPKQAIKIIPLDNNNETAELNFAVASTDAKEFLKILEKKFLEGINHGTLNSPIVKHNLSALAVVGKRMKSKKRLAARLLNAIERQGIKVEAHNLENSDTTWIYLIDQEKTGEVLNLSHSIIF